jgi:hypothetical protein
MNTYIDIPSTVLRKSYTKDYHKNFLGPLVEQKIVIRSPYYNSRIPHLYKGYQAGKNKAFGYRINDDLFNFSDLVLVQYRNNPKKPKAAIQEILDDLAFLEFDVEGMMEEVKNFKVDELVEVNEDILEEKIEIVDMYFNREGKRRHYIINTDQALYKARSRGQDLILYNGLGYIFNIESFKRIRENNYRASQVYAINRLINQDFYAAIHPTNNRLNTNLSNLKKTFLERGYVKLLGEQIVEIDMKNSQPTLLAYILADIDAFQKRFSDIGSGHIFPEIGISSPDVKEFVAKAGLGLIYDHLAEIMGCNRDYTKLLFLKVMYAKPGWNSSDKRRVREVYPSVVKWMDDFKKQNLNDNSLAILLQKLEAEIFIQQIYFPLKKEYTIFSKHDSILCRLSQKPEIMKKMEAILDQFGFMYTLK